jgi:hypothetical protein
MKHTVCKFVVLAVCAFALTGLAVAQDDTYSVTANIPFDFYVGSQKLPAGTYLFNVSYGDHSVMVRNHNTGRSTVVLAVAAEGARGSEAVLDFDVIGSNYLLSDLTTASNGVKFSEQKQLTKLAQKGGSVAIVARLRRTENHSQGATAR